MGLPLTACWRDSGLIADRFEELRIELVETPAVCCDGDRDVVQATLAGAPLVGTTEMLGDDGVEIARLQYPIKTMNVNDPAHSPSGDWIYQVDTGPMIAPESSGRGDLSIEALEIAFIAWNMAEGAELIALGPTPVSHSDDCVGHYSRVRKIAARNELLALKR